MRPALILVPSPDLDLGAGIGQRQEPVGVQALVAQATIERFHERIVRWLAGLAEVERDAILLSPAIKRLRDKLRPIVDPDRAGRPARRRDPGRCLDDLLALDALVDVDRQRLACERIDHRQRP